MKIVSEQIRLAATDLSNHLACRHLTSLDLSVARGERGAPEWRSPDLAVIQQLGLRHEAAYLEWLREKGVSLADLREIGDEEQALAETRSCMERGVEAIAQGSMKAGRWFGRPDVLRKVEKPSRLGDWSYEVYDCKLSRETKAATILQLALYSALLKELQGEEPEFMHVVTPSENFEAESYRFAEYAAYYRYVRERLEKVCKGGQSGETYPEPCLHCDICRWFRECDATRREDDHLSLVAGIRRQQRNQLEEWDTETMAKLAVLPIPLKQRPKHGSKEGYERVREQARVQVAGRNQQAPVCELLPVAEGMGLCRLPEPSADDVFIDLEGDPFTGESGLQYLFGFAFRNAGGELSYEKRWALNREEEKSGFEWLVDEIMHRREANPRMHVYHFGAYEPGTLKRLMGMHATREDEIDRLLRAGVLVDLHQAFKQGVRASVEEYSLKKLEAFYGFARQTPLDESREAMRYIEHRLELGWGDEKLPDSVREVMEGYNRDDCLSAAGLRDWLEEERRKLMEGGIGVPRFVDREEGASEELDERQKRVAELVRKLTDGIPADLEARTNEQQAQWLLAQLQDWHRREDKATYWEGYRLADLDDADLLEERAGLAGLRFLERLLVERKIPVDRYGFDKQETEARIEKDLYYKGEKFGSVSAIDPVGRTIDIKKTRKTAELHPTAVYVWERPFAVTDLADALWRVGIWVAENGVDGEGSHRAARDLLLRKAPRLKRGERVAALPGEAPLETACRVAAALNASVFAIQGPPGAGKTYTGARMVCELVEQGRKIGIAAFSHKAIQRFLKELQIEAGGFERGIRCVRKITDEDPTDQLDGVELTKKPEIPLLRLRSGEAQVAAGTAWLWARPEYLESVDTLFVDEAGQMALADVIPAVQCAKNLILIGDPQQLERPLKGSHPAGAEKSALQHLLGERKTIPETMGLLLPETWRMHPRICDFTSELFYDGRLGARSFTRNRVLEGHPWLSGAGLWFVPVVHEGNRNSSFEEVETVAQIVESLLVPGVVWFRGAGNSEQLKLDHIVIVAPYNAQVFDLSARLPGAQIGTVDKFQGQEAPVVIYSLTTSSPEEAPRGMEFLYSLNRLNVATSRGMSNVIVVGSPRLFEPECRTPRQMQLANALCRYLELATTVPAPRRPS